MKLSRLIFGLLIAVVFVSYLSFNVSNQAFSQTQIPDVKVVKPGEGVTWKQTRLPLLPVNSRINLHLPTLSANPDWIVGVSPTKEGERQEIAVGVVDWQSLNVKNRPEAAKIVNVSNYQIDAIENRPGGIILKDLASFRNSNQSLVIFIKASPDTLVNIYQKDNFLGKRKAERGFAVHNNLPVIDGGNNVTRLLTQLQTNKLLRGFGNKNK